MKTRHCDVTPYLSLTGCQIIRHNPGCLFVVANLFVGGFTRVSFERVSVSLDEKCLDKAAATVAAKAGPWSHPYKLHDPWAAEVELA